MYYHNNTEAFMERKFHPEDYKYVRNVARNLEGQGLETKRKKELVQHLKAKNDRRRIIQEKRKQKALERENRIASVNVIVNREEVLGLKGQKLKDYLHAYKQWQAPIPGSITVRSKVAEIRQALQIAVDKYNAGEWRVTSNTPTTDEGESEGEEFVEEDEDSCWEDEEI